MVVIYMLQNKAVMAADSLSVTRKFGNVTPFDTNECKLASLGHKTNVLYLRVLGNHGRVEYHNGG